MQYMKKALIGLSALLIFNPVINVQAQQKESELETNLRYTLYSNCAKTAQSNGHDDKIVRKVGLACVSIYNYGLTGIRNGSIKMPAWRGRKTNDIKIDIMSAVLNALAKDKNPNNLLMYQVLFQYLSKDQYQEKIAFSSFAVADTIVKQDLGISK